MSPSEGNFKDILEERRNTSDAKWAARRWNPTSAYVQSHKSDSASLKITVLQSTRLRHVIKQVSEDENTSDEELYRRVWSILNEMAFNRELPVLRWLGLFVSKLLKRLCSAIYVNEDTVLRLKSKMGQNPILFVPSHRSYGDFILMSYICFHYEIDIPRIAAGMDFQGMTLIGEILRDACAFFMRRTFSNDKLYSATFSEYVQTLVTHGDAGVEFFIEGTRSRTAKAIMPKFGFLSMALKPFLMGLVPDISIVPVTLSYDRCLEESLFAYEMIGVPKPKESTKGFFKAMKILKDDYGKVFVNFGEPLSAKEFLNGRIDRSLHGFGPVLLQDVTPVESRQVVALAHRIVKKQRGLTVLCSFNVLASVLSDHLVRGQSSCDIDTLTSEVRWLTKVLSDFGAVVDILDDDDASTCIKNSINVHKSLVSIRGREVCLSVSQKHAAISDSSQLRGHDVSPSTMDIAIPFIMLQHYVNPTAHYFIHMTFIILALRQSPCGQQLSKGDLFNEYKWFRRLFAHEFVFYFEDENEDFELSLAQGFDLAIIRSDSDVISLGSNSKLQEFCVRFLAPFLPGYVALIEALLLVDCTLPLTDADILKKAQQNVERKLTSGRIAHPGNLSLDLLSNCLHSLTSLGALFKVKSEEGVVYFVNAVTLEEIQFKLCKFEEWLPKLLSNEIAAPVVSKL